MKLVVLLISVFSLVATADYKDFYFNRLQALQPTGGRALGNRSKLEVQSFEQRLNHLDESDQRVFSQRYFINTQYAQSKSSPTLYFLCGESTCNGPAAGISFLASQLKANLIAIEHRYYGKSQPFTSLTTENLKYLTTDYALKDAARFQKYAMTTLGFNGKWIVVGGSYAGSLAAFYRQKYPELVVGALASSGPVQAEENFEAYDHHVAVVAGPKCLAQIKKVTAQVEYALSDTTELNRLKKLFSAEKMVNNLDFVYLVADMGALAIQYGYKDKFCNMLNTENPMEGYADFTQEIYSSWGMNALSGSAAGAVSVNPTDYEKDFGMRQWFYQSCTEYGYWQNAFHDSNFSARSQLINLEYHQDICRRLFGINTPVPTAKTNEQFYLPLINKSTSQIFFTNGSTDPWIHLSIAQINGNTSNNNVAHMTIEGAAHCDDLRAPKPSDSQSLKTARSIFLEFANEWLK